MRTALANELNAKRRRSRTGRCNVSQGRSLAEHAEVDSSHRASGPDVKFRRATLLLAALALTGCNTLPTNTLRTELAWQSANLVDGYQTSQYQHNDCKEVGTWKYITGPEPSVERTALAAGINGALHFAVTWALERFDAPRGLKNAWGYTTLGLTGGQVVSNASLGCD